MCEKSQSKDDTSAASCSLALSQLDDAKRPTQRCGDDPLDYSLPNIESSRRRLRARHYGAVFVCLKILERWMELGLRPETDLVVAMSRAVMHLAIEEERETSSNVTRDIVDGERYQERLWRLWERPVDDLSELKAVVRDTRRLLWQQALDPAPDPHLRIDASRIPGANQGLFATRDIKAGAIVCYYSGDVHSVASSQKLLTDASYVLRIGCGGCSARPWWYEALQTTDTASCEILNKDGATCYETLAAAWDRLGPAAHEQGEFLVNPTNPAIKARYINDCLDETQYNVKYVMDAPNERAIVVALRDIRVGEEMYVSYGSAYWQSLEVAMGIVPRRLTRSCSHEK